MAKWSIAGAVGLVLAAAHAALAATGSAHNERSIIVPMLLDFQPVVMALDLGHDIPAQLGQFCITHLLDLKRCFVLEDAIADVVRREKGGRTSLCRPREKLLAPSFVRIKHLLVDATSPAQQPSFQWLEDAPNHIATDICSFLARSHAAIDGSSADCVEPLAAAITRSFQWLNAISACADNAPLLSIGLRSVGQKTLADCVVGSGVDEKKKKKKNTAAVATTTFGSGDHAITITPLPPVELHPAMPLNGDHAAAQDNDQEHEAPMDERLIRMVPITDDGDASSTAHEAKLRPLALACLEHEMVVLLSFGALVMAIQWLLRRIVLQHKRVGMDSASLHSGNVVAPVQVLVERLAAPAALSTSSANSEQSFDRGVAMIHRVSFRATVRVAWQQWRAAALRPQDTPTSTRLHKCPEQPPSNASVAETEEALAPLEKAATHDRKASYSLVAMSLLLTPCLPIVSPWPPCSERADANTPLAKVTRLLEAESAAAELLDQFDAAQRTAQDESAAARRIQHEWRAWRSKQSHSHKLLPRASQLFHQVRRLQSRFAMANAGQSASSA